MANKKHFNILILGAGPIGSFLYEVLSSYGYYVRVLDNKPHSPQSGIEEVDYSQRDLVAMPSRLYPFYGDAKAVISCLPHALTHIALELAKVNSAYYFDFTEDIVTTHKTKKLDQWAKANKFALVPGCGLAPGYVEILAAHVVRQVEKEYGGRTIKEVEMYVGGNPQEINPPSNYAFTWSVDGLVNQYLNDCLIRVNGEVGLAPSLSGRELYSSDQEAFFTSGGHGQFYDFAKEHNIPNASYRTIRHKGHLSYILNVLSQLPAASFRESFKDTLLREIANTKLDKVEVMTRATAYVENKNPDYKYGGFYAQKKKVMIVKAREVLGKHRTAMQIATVGSAAQVIDYVLQNSHKKKFQGYVAQTSIFPGVFKDKKNFPELIIK